MEYVRFGNAGISVSRLALGCMDFPVTQDEATAASILDSALDHGINLIDTADTYGKGQSEEVLGRILKGKRDKIILATKFWVNMHDRPNGGGCSRVHIMQALEDSLRRLRTDYVDLYQVHHPDRDTPVEEVLSTMDTLVQQGKIRYIGVSNHWAWQMAHMLGVSALHNWEPLVSIQCRYNILDRVIENETVPFAQRFNIAMMVYSPLNSSILSGRYKKGEPFPEDSRLVRLPGYQKKLTDGAWEALDRLHEIADGNGMSLPQLSYAWLLSKPFVTTIIMGGHKPEHFESLYGIEESNLDPAVVEEIDQISEPWRYGPFHNQRIAEGFPAGLNWW